MKILLSLFFSLFTSILFLLYLNTIEEFLPFTELSSYNWSNILTVVVLISVAVFSFVSIVISFIQIVLKKGIGNISWYVSIKYAGIVVIFLLALSILYFFHILTWYWVVCMCILLGILIVTI